MLIDTHAHYDDVKFDEDRHACLMRVHAQGVDYIINAAQDLPSLHACIALAEAYDFVYITAGIHPHEASSWSEEGMRQIADLAQHTKVVAIGETGLDYHYDFSPREMQIQNFISNIGLARELKKPVVIHDREAHGDMLRILQQEKIWEIGAVMHCYSGSAEMARQLTDMGLYFSVGGAVTFKNARRIAEALRVIPNERLMLETDCPYMTPEPFRGHRNDSGYLPYTARRIAEIKEISYEELCSLTSGNSKRFFNILHNN